MASFYAQGSLAIATHHGRCARSNSRRLALADMIFLIAAQLYPQCTQAGSCRSPMRTRPHAFRNACPCAVTRA